MKICGLISDNPDVPAPALLDQMYEASWQSCYKRREVWSNGPAGLGHFSIGAVNTELQPIIDPTSEAVAVFCGKIFDYDTDRRSLKEEGAFFQFAANDGEFLLHWVHRRETQELRRINGIFSLAVWDAASNILLLTGDRYGFRPLYYYHDAPRGVFAFASDLRAILATGLPPLRVNWRSVNSFLHLGHPIGEETLFEGIFRLPPASILTFENNKIRLDRYWQLADLPVQENMTMGDAVDGCVALFQQAIKRRMKASSVRHMVLLSGGQDSRHIAAELKRQRVEFTAYTTTGFKPMVQDKVLADRAARALGISHVYVPLPKKDFLTC
ncbi:MAG: asparagine synthetase B [candidate division Zixibacteria bacterium]|nr:asparagine synthetase B [candidate division Zixibacteria bacterium]